MIRSISDFGQIPGMERFSETFRAAAIDGLLAYASRRGITDPIQAIKDYSRAQQAYFVELLSDKEAMQEAKEACRPMTMARGRAMQRSRIATCNAM